jgi:hypothetical protein
MLIPEIEEQENIINLFGSGLLLYSGDSKAKYFEIGTKIGNHIKSIELPIVELLV